MNGQIILFLKFTQILLKDENDTPQTPPKRRLCLGLFGAIGSVHYLLGTIGLCEGNMKQACNCHECTMMRDKERIAQFFQQASQSQTPKKEFCCEYSEGKWRSNTKDGAIIICCQKCMDERKQEFAKPAEPKCDPVEEKIKTIPQYMSQFNQQPIGAALEGIERFCRELLGLARKTK